MYVFLLAKCGFAPITVGYIIITLDYNTTGSFNPIPNLHHGNGSERLVVVNGRRVRDEFRNGFLEEERFRSALELI